MRSFIPWVGGKSLLAPRIVSLIPPHRVYVEPFMGAAWVFFRKPKESSKVEVLNDLNGDLVALFRVVRDDWEELFRRRAYLISAERDYKDFVRRLARQEWRDDVERALMFWYSLRSAFGAQLGHGWAFSRVRQPRSLDMTELEAVHARLKGVYVGDQPALACLQRWDGPETFFYLDPPYIVTTRAAGRAYYRHVMTLEEHQALREALGRLQGKWLLSYDDDPWVREAYQGLPMLTPEVRYTIDNRPGARRRRATELLVANYELASLNG